MAASGSPPGGEVRVGGDEGDGAALMKASYDVEAPLAKRFVEASAGCKVRAAPEDETMRRLTALTLATMACVLSLASTALGRDPFCKNIPNGGLNCENCHPGGVNTNLNVFGQSLIDLGLCDVNGIETKPAAEWWAVLVNEDPDGDGQSNGAELGDPCGDWKMNATPARTTGISEPGNNASTAPDPGPACAGAGGSGSGPGTGGAGGSPMSSGGAGMGGNGNGSGNGSGGDDGGGNNESQGAGMAEPPLPTRGSCATAPGTPGPDGTFALVLTAAGLLVARSRRKNSK